MTRLCDSLTCVLLHTVLGHAMVSATASIDKYMEMGDNWGSPGLPVDIYKGLPLKKIFAGCQWNYTDFALKFKGAVLNFYNSTQAWASYKGHDMLSHSSTNVPQHKKYAKTYREDEILAGTCEVKDPNDGSTWVAQRIGPFRSKGNYDWWQFAWDDVFHTTDLMNKYPEGIYITKHFTGGVDASGDVLPFPPIHVHHVHASPGFKNVYWADPLDCMRAALTGRGDKSNVCNHAFHVVYEQHGDYQCTDRDGGVKCLLEDLPSGYAKLLVRPLTINGELNDVRAPNSPEMVWWYQTAMQYTPKVIADKRQESLQLKPLSFHYMWSPGRFNFSDQSTMVNTFLAPTYKDTFIWFTGHMQHDADFVRAKMHTHNTLFDESYLFAATPAQLGMDTPNFRPKGKVYDVMDPKDMGFESIAAIKQHIMDRYERCRQLDSSVRIICHARTDNADVAFDGVTYKFDRRAPVFCEKWNIKRGEPFVVIGFNKFAGSPIGPHAPGVIPKWLPGHLHWFIMTDTHDGKSHYTYGFYNQDLGMNFGTDTDAHIPWGSVLNNLIFVWNRGMPSATEWWYWCRVVVALLTMVLVGFLVFGTGLILAIRRIAKGCKQQ